jgi:hypothetical protein
MSGIDDIAAERKRQIEKEGFSQSSDLDKYRAESNDLVAAAISYSRHYAGHRLLHDGTAEGDKRYQGTLPPPTWPWSRAWWKPRDPRRDLVRAGALIAAEIDRLDRLEDQRKAGG